MRGWTAAVSVIWVLGCSAELGEVDGGMPFADAAADGGGSLDDAGGGEDGGGGHEDGGGDHDAGASMDGGPSMDAAMPAGDAGPSDGGADAGTDGGSDAGTTPTCPAFTSPPLTWGLPPAGTAATFTTTDTIACPGGSSSPRFSLIDLSGDGRDDLVVTGSCSGTGTGVGFSRWELYLNTGAGFATSPASWPLPSGYALGFHDLETTGCSGSSPRWRIFDIDGDERPDLVIPRRCDGTGMVGTTHWLVHRNNGAGFDDAASMFTLPAYGGGIPDVEGRTCVGASQRWTLLDVDGDGDPDLVVTHLCVSPGGVGTTRWLVHRNDGTRFASAATDFTLPSGYRAASFVVADSESCPLGDSPRFATTDLDGDRLPDLVVTSLCSGGAIGRMHWAVHRGAPGGFTATPTSWTLPSYTPGNFLTLEGLASCGVPSQPYYRLVDADGDAMPELVILGVCDGSGTIGRADWRVHPNTGAAFGAALSWALPSDYPGALLADTSNVVCPSGGTPRYEVRDLDGDGAMDFITTSVCGGSAGVGTTHWDVHTGCMTGRDPRSE